MKLIVDVRVDCLEIILRRHVASIICNDNLDFYRTKKKSYSLHYSDINTLLNIDYSQNYDSWTHFPIIFFFAKYLQTA